MTDKATRRAELERSACELRQQGLEIYKVADQLGITKSKAYRILKSHGLNHRLHEYAGKKPRGRRPLRRSVPTPTPETSRVMLLNTLWRIPEAVL